MLVCGQDRKHIITGAISTYVVGFWPFPAGYFWQPASRPMLTGPRGAFWALQLSVRAPVAWRSRFGKMRYWTATVRESVPVWFRLRRVRTQWGCRSPAQLTGLVRRPIPRAGFTTEWVPSAPV